MKPSPSLRLCALLLVLSMLWLALGAPLAAVEWREIPLRMERLLLQLPSRAQPMLHQWLLKGASTSARAEGPLAGLTLRIWRNDDRAAREIPLEAYVTGVVAAEMPARYGTEALRCQAVAARTRAVYACRALGGNGCAAHPDCDLCDSPACCQGYRDMDGRAAAWGSEASVLEARVVSAVQATRGQILTYDGLPIEVLYHACSGGRTEDAAAVFARGQPYLVSVSSPGEESYDGYTARVSFTLTQAAGLLREAFPGCGVTAEGLPGQLRLLSTTASGRVDTMMVGTRTVTGRELRQALSLRSTLISWDADDTAITFTTLGYGHGVGMSQAGAQAMAAQGAGYADILAHYYPGTSLSQL